MTEHWCKWSRCAYCLEHKRRTEMTRVPPNSKTREEYINILGNEFAERCRQETAPRLCLTHFDLMNGKRLRWQLPRKRDDDIHLVELSTENCKNEECRTNDNDDLLSNPIGEGVLLTNEKNEGSNNDESFDVSEHECRREEISNADEANIAYFLCEKKSIAFLLQYCRSCASKDVKITYQFSGALVEASCECIACESKWKWRSSGLCVPQHEDPQGKLRNVNLDLTTSILTSGQSYSKMKDVFTTIGCPIFSKQTYHTLKRKYSYPAIDEYYMQQHCEVIKLTCSKMEKDGPLNLAGDGQFDSRGYTAYLCRYTILDVDTKLVIGYSIMKRKREESASLLEPQSHQTALRSVEDELKKASGIAMPIATVTTDRHRTIATNMKTHFQHLEHLYDSWHYLRTLTMDILKKKKQKHFAPLNLWTKSMINHLYWAISISNGDGDLAKENVLTFFAHVCNQHDNFQDITWYNFQKVHRCAHGDMNNSDYLNPHNKKHMRAWNSLFDLITRGKRLDDLAKISPFFSTSTTESFNSRATTYAPKDFFFSLRGFDVLMKLSVAHWNRLQLDEMSGKRKIIGKRRYYCKTRKTVVTKNVKTPADLSWRKEILILARNARRDEREKKINYQNEGKDYVCNEVYSDDSDEECSDDSDIEMNLDNDYGIDYLIECATKSVDDNLEEEFYEDN